MYYRDKLAQDSEEHGYVEGKVVEFKSIDEAEREWDQNWSRKKGTILKIRCEHEPEIYRYRHTSAVITPDQFEEKQLELSSGRVQTTRRV